MDERMESWMAAVRDAVIRSGAVGVSGSRGRAKVARMMGRMAGSLEVWYRKGMAVAEAADRVIDVRF